MSEQKSDDKQPVEKKAEAKAKDVRVDVSVALPQATATERVTVAPGRTVLIAGAGDPLTGEPASTAEHGPGAILDLHPTEAARLRATGYLLDRTGGARVADGRGPATSTESV